MVRCNPCSVYSGKPVLLANKKDSILKHTATKKHEESVAAKGALVQTGLQQLTITTSFQQQAEVRFSIICVAAVP